jgi:protein TonB
VTKSYYRKRKKRRNDILYAFLFAILIHLLFFLVIFLNPDLLNLQANKEQKKEDKDYIEITEYRDKETEPPEKSKLLAEKSHKAIKESAPDKTTRLTKPPSPKPSPAKKPPQTKKPEKVAKKEPVKEKIKTNNEVLRDHKLSKLPKQKWLREKKEPQKNLNEIGKELVKSNPAEFPSPYSSTQPSRVGARHVQNKEETIDLNTTEFKYYSYFLGLKKQIEGVWHYPRDAALRGEHGSLNLIFTISSNGDLDGIQVVSSSGFRSLDGEALRAIKVAAPFHPFPKSWQGLEKLNVKATFEYTYRNFLR